jgi:methionyl aminopeptidase
MSRDLAERVGEGHDHATLLEARRRTIAAVRDIAACVAPGMTEEEGTELACRALRAHGFERDWAAPYLRFGTNTLRKFGEPSEPGVVLGRDDLWFIDVGPLWRNHECDYADSFATGVDPDRQRIVRDLHAVFERTQAHWRASQATGAELYRFAAAEAAARGWQLDLEMAGTGSASFRTRRSTTGSSLGRGSGRRRGSGCSRFSSVTPTNPTAPSSRTSCSTQGTSSPGARARDPARRRRVAAGTSYPAAFTAWISSAATFCASP